MPAEILETYISELQLKTYLIYVAYSRPNGSTESTEFFCGQSWGAGNAFG